jgi:hypothetical protein
VFSGGRITGTIDGKGGDNSIEISDSTVFIPPVSTATPSEDESVKAAVEVPGNTAVILETVEVPNASVSIAAGDDALTVESISAVATTGNLDKESAPLADDSQDVVAVATAEFPTLSSVPLPSESGTAGETTTASGIDFVLIARMVVLNDIAP